MKNFNTICLIAILFTCFAANAEEKIFLLSNKASIDVPFTVHDNRILVEAEIDGKNTLTFIFDTGGSNIITLETAQKLNLNLENWKTVSGGAGPNAVKQAETKLKRVTIGDLTMNDQVFGVLDLSHIKKAFRFKKLDGVIGYEILQKFVTRIDFEKSKITFMLAGQILNSKNASVVSFEIDHRKPIVLGAVDGVAGKFLVDTGDRSSFTLFPKFANKNKLDAPFLKEQQKITGFGVGGPIYAHVSNIKTLAVGDQTTLNNVIARLPPHEKWDIGGSIGNQILRQFTVTFDYQKKTMTLVKNKYFGESFRFVPVPNI
jgi:predicted aspartyl protease